jgi:HK97 family phage prohead protease
MTELEYKSFELKSIDFNKETKEMIVEGYAATFGGQDSPQMTYNRDLREYVMAVDTIEQGAFSKTISERKARIAFCKNHNLEDPKAKILEIKEDSKGLYFKARISDAEPELKTKIAEKIFSELSIGFTVMNTSWEKKADGTYLRKLVEIKLYEISIVTIARDENSKLSKVELKSLDLEGMRGYIDELYKTEKEENKRYKLLQLKSLLTFEPEAPPEKKEPKKEVVDFDKMNFN